MQGQQVAEQSYLMKEAKDIVIGHDEKVNQIRNYAGAKYRAVDEVGVGIIMMIQKNSKLYIII